MSRLPLSLLILLALGSGAGAGYLWAQRAFDAPFETVSPSQREILYWYDPMVPEQRFDKPGKSPFMDMDLVPRYADEVSATGIDISPDIRQNLGIRMASVATGRLPGEVRVPGTLTWDVRNERVVSARVDAQVERLHVRRPYEAVQAGQPLATLLAPDWSSAIAEYHALGGARSDEARELQRAAAERLRILGVPAGATQAGGGRVVLRAPSSGVVSEIAVRQGETVPAGAMLFRINGIESLWLEAAIPEAASGAIRSGTPVEATTNAQPGQVFNGHVETLLPTVEPTSRTRVARIVVENANGTLAPGMYVQVTLRPESAREHPLVPSEAVIATGTGARVIVLNDDGGFEPRVVSPGRSAAGQTEILSGLTAGEQVVASGQFLIDSEASLSGALERLEAEDPPAKDRASSEPSGMAGMSRESTEAREQEGRKVLYWYDPMVPDQHFDKPGKSPFMDMQLVPKYADDADGQQVPERQP